ncbi:MAG: class IV adenylate cyclase [Ferruginibacter sp.]
MAILNIEFKAKCSDITAAENILLAQKPLFKGTDHQVDTYFNVPTGRMKLREGNIENALIHYERENTAGSKSSHVLLYQHQPDINLKEVLTEALGIKAVVDKQRKIYFIDNVKFHFDEVKNLGTFIEVEAIDTDGSIGKEKLQQQCDGYAEMLGVQPGDFMAVSYSDMIMAQTI